MRRVALLCSLLASTDALSVGPMPSQNPQATVESLVNHLTLNPDDGDSHIELGSLWRSLGVASLAVESFTTAAELDQPQIAAVAFQHLAELLADDFGDFDEAEAALVQSIALNGQRSSSWCSYGRLLCQSGRYHRAQAAFERACDLAPEDRLAWVGLATVLRTIGRFKDARSAFREAAALGWASSSDQSLCYFAYSEQAEAALVLALASCVRWSTVLAAPRGATWLPSSWQPSLSSVFATQVASPSECEWVIEQADRCARSAGGWLADGHHDQFPTTDVVVADDPELLEWLNAKLGSVVWPALSAQFGVGVEELWLTDAFVVRYEPEAEGRPGLPLHLEYACFRIPPTIRSRTPPVQASLRRSFRRR